MAETKKSISIMVLMGLLIAASAMAALASHRKHVATACRDLRIAMDGSYSAVVETGGLNPSPELTIYQEHNRKHVRVEKVEVALRPGKDGVDTYVGKRVKLVLQKQTQPSTGRQIASLQGVVGGESVSATMSCAK